MSQVTAKLGRSTVSILLVDFLPTLLINMINQEYQIKFRTIITEFLCWFFIPFELRLQPTSSTWRTRSTSWWSPSTSPAWWSSPPSTSPSLQGKPFPYMFFSWICFWIHFIVKSRPPTASIKTIEVWLLFNLAYPFLVIMVNIMLQVNKQKIQAVTLDFRERKRQKGSGQSNL